MMSHVQGPMWYACHNSFSIHPQDNNHFIDATLYHTQGPWIISQLMTDDLQVPTCTTQLHTGFQLPSQTKNDMTG